MRSKVIMAGALVAAALVLSACGTDPSTPGGTGSTETTGTGADPNRDGCLIGTWQVDVADMAQQGAALMRGMNATGTGEGTITLVFGDAMTITYANSITFTVPMSSMPMLVKAAYTGTATSTDWSAKDGLIKGTMPTNTIVASMTATVGGQSVPMGNVPFQGALDMSQGNLGYTCSGNSATFINPVGISWKLSKA